MMSPPPAPLSGIKVLDLTRVLAGPLCGAILGDLGAEVVKVEHPLRGDDTRKWGLRVGKSETTYYNAFNRNKKSLTLDLEQKAGQEIAVAIAARSDIVIENFKAGGADKLGLAYNRLSALNPGLIYLSISGYDPAGEEASRLGYDLVIQGEAGLMAINGEKDQPPLKFGTAVVDMFTGMYAAQAIMAALIERGRTGKGRHIQLALFDCGLTLTAYAGLEALLTGEEPLRYGNGHSSIVPYGVFDAQDGPLVLAIGNDGQYARFCEAVIERPDLATDPRFATNQSRSEHRGTLLPLLEDVLARLSRHDLLARLAANGIPCGEVLKLGEALTSARARSSGLITLQQHPDAGAVHVLASPYRFDGERCGIRLRPPRLGEHSEEILREVLGKTPVEVQGLVDQAVIRPANP